MPILKGLRNIVYDSDNCVVFIKNKLAYKLGGNPSMNASSVAGDIRGTPKAREIWKLFAEHNAEYVEETPLVKELLNRVVSHKKEPVNRETGKRKEKMTAANIQTLVTDLTASLDNDDRDLVLRVWKYLTTSASTSKPISEGQQLKIAEKIAQEPPLKIARAAFEFIDGRCMQTGKRSNYFFGIVRNSATSWYLEYQSAKEKKEFGLK